jgi:hypothetical protein
VRALMVTMPVILVCICRLVDPRLCIDRLRGRIEQACSEESSRLDLTV